LSKTNNQDKEDGVFIVFCHGTVAACHGIELGAALWFALTSNGGGSSAWGKGVCVEDTPLMIINACRICGSQGNQEPNFQGVGGCAPLVGGRGENIQTAWVGEMGFHCLELLGLGGLGVLHTGVICS
jgi:hypothetical protein